MVTDGDPVTTEGSTSEDSAKQGFWLAPPIAKIQGPDNDDPENLSKKPKVDWSYATRKRMAMLKNMTPYRQS